jgi:hypothetical protein
MNDSYQAIYDAVRSRISNGDIGSAVSEAARNAFDISHVVAMLHQDFSIAAAEMQRPFVLLKPSVFTDGNQWGALYGENLQNGVAGFGNSPHLASLDFDKNWYAALAREETKL